MKQEPRKLFYTFLEGVINYCELMDCLKLIMFSLGLELDCNQKYK